MSDSGTIRVVRIEDQLRVEHLGHWHDVSKLAITDEGRVRYCVSLEDGSQQWLDHADVRTTTLA